MNTTKNPIPSPEGQRQLKALRQAAGKTLDKKRRLGHYAVIWKDGKPIRKDADAPLEKISTP